MIRSKFPLIKRGAWMQGAWVCFLKLFSKAQVRAQPEGIERELYTEYF